jgi:mRNA interferase RelE/StbE
MYRLFLTHEFDQSLKKLAASDRARIEKKIQIYIGPQLKHEPHFGLNIKKLSGYEPETWRYRIGDFRLFYLIDEHTRIVKVISIDLRKDSYK